MQFLLKTFILTFCMLGVVTLVIWLVSEPKVEPQSYEEAEARAIARAKKLLRYYSIERCHLDKVPNLDQVSVEFQDNASAQEPGNIYFGITLSNGKYSFYYSSSVDFYDGSPYCFNYPKELRIH